MTRLAPRLCTWLRRKLGIYSPCLMAIGDPEERAWWAEYARTHPGARLDLATHLIVYGWPGQGGDA